MFLFKNFFREKTQIITSFVLSHQGEIFVFALLGLFTRVLLLLFTYFINVDISIIVILLVTIINYFLAFFYGKQVLQLYVYLFIKPLMTTKLGQMSINIFYQFIIWLKSPGSIYSDVLLATLILIYIGALFKGVSSIVIFFAFIFLFHQFTVRAEFFTFDKKHHVAGEIEEVVPFKIENYIQKEVQLPVDSKRFRIVSHVKLGYWALNYIRDSNPIVKSIVREKPLTLSVSRTFLFPVPYFFGRRDRRHVGNVMHAYSMLSPQARKMLVVTGVVGATGYCAHNYIELKKVQAKANASVDKSHNRLKEVLANNKAKIKVSEDKLQVSKNKLQETISNNEVKKLELEAKLAELKNKTPQSFRDNKGLQTTRSNSKESHIDNFNIGNGKPLHTKISIKDDNVKLDSVLEPEFSLFELLKKFFTLVLSFFY